MSDDRPTINWTPEMLSRFKAAYALANIKRDDWFRFDGHDFDTRYAMYLIQYLDERFNEAQRSD